MRKITNFFSPLLREIRYRNKPDPFAKFLRLRKNERFPALQKGNVLLLPIRVAPVSNLFEGVYGYALKLRGYKVHALMCDQILIKCDHMTKKNSNSFNCSLCRYEQKRFSNAFSVIPHSYESLLDKETIKKIRDITTTIEADKIQSLKYDDVFLGHHIKSAVMRHLLISDVDSCRHENLLREYAVSTLLSYESTKRLVLKLEPKFVLTSHGVYSTWGGALEACKKLNVEVIVWGRGYVGGNIVASRNQSYLYERAVEPVKYWENIALSLQQKEKVKNYFLAKRNPVTSVDHVNYYAGFNKSNAKKEYKFLEPNKNGIKFGLFPNIPWDGTTFSASKVFPTMEMFFEITINWFIENPQHDLIIRAHPAELKNKGMETIKDLIDSIYSILPSNVYFLGPDHDISSYEIEEVSDVCLMYASTMALEISYFGKAVIQAGQSNVSNKEFIFEPNNKQEYLLFLERAARKDLSMTDIMKERVEKYAYHWIYRRHIPENIYERKGLTFTKYNIETSMNLTPGKNKIVDWFIDRCEDGEPFIWDE